MELILVTGCESVRNELLLLLPMYLFFYGDGRNVLWHEERIPDIM